MGKDQKDYGTTEFDDVETNTMKVIGGAINFTNAPYVFDYVDVTQTLTVSNFLDLRGNTFTFHSALLHTLKMGTFIKLWVQFDITMGPQTNKLQITLPSTFAPAIDPVQGNMVAYPSGTVTNLLYRHCIMTTSRQIRFIESYTIDLLSSQASDDYGFPTNVRYKASVKIGYVIE